MKNYCSKTIFNALIICLTVGNNVHPNTAPINIGYETSTPFVMPTYQPQAALTNQYSGTQSTETAPTREIQVGKTLLRSLSHLSLNIFPVPFLGELFPGWIHRSREGDDELLHSEELIEWFLSGSFLLCGLTYPLITASTAERVIVTLLPALLAVATNKKELAPLILSLYLPNLLASLKMAQRKRDNPETKGWELKQSKIWWQLLYTIPCFIAGSIASQALDNNPNPNSDFYNSSDSEGDDY
jgi:hypothetical protein